MGFRSIVPAVHLSSKCVVIYVETAATALAGIFAAQRITSEKFSEKKFLFVGGNSTVVGIADLLAFAISKAKGILLHEAREQIWIYDSEVFCCSNQSVLLGWIFPSLS